MGDGIEPQTFLDGRVILHCGDCLGVMAELPAASVEAIVTDPPYHLASIVKRFGAPNAAPAKSDGATGVYERASRGFMGKSWDGGDIAFQPATWVAALRVLKPGGYLVAFGAPKNAHRLTCAIEDAGFEIRDSLMWLFGTGFPKSLNVAKAIDAKIIHGNSHSSAMRRANETRPGEGRISPSLLNNGIMSGERHVRVVRDEAQTEEAAEWQGWGTALKPAYEPIILARKPLDGTVAENVIAHGTGALNIDGCRVETADKLAGSGTPPLQYGGANHRPFHDRAEPRGINQSPLGRWPANVVHDGSEEVVTAFPQSGPSSDAPRNNGDFKSTAKGHERAHITFGYADAGGSAARFFYSAKADSDDRIGSKHPTVKPIDLMRWLCRLVTPPGGTILDPFAGTGTTGEAAFYEGFNAVLIEREPEYQADIARRMKLVHAGPEERKRAILAEKSKTNSASDDGPLFGGST